MNIPYRLPLIAFLCLTVFASAAQVDSARYRSLISLLERKLTYTYYNPEQKTWYVNRFNCDPETGTVRFKSTSSKNPLKVIGKKYTERVFRFEDLNPYNITITNIEEHRGLIVKGQLIRLETVKHQDLIKKTINGMSGTPQSYIHFSIPDYMMDSIPNYASDLADALTEIVRFSSDLRNTGEKERNRAIILESLTGEHICGERKRFTKEFNPHTLEYEEYLDRKRVSKGLMGFDPSKDLFFQVDQAEDGSTNFNYFRMEMDRAGLVLLSKDTLLQQQIEFENKSLFRYIQKQDTLECRPSGSF